MLVRLSKANVLEQLANIRRMAARAGKEVRDWKVRIPRNCDKPTMDVVYDVETVGDTVYLRPCSAEGSTAMLAMMSILKDADIQAMSMGEVEKALAESPADKIAIGWPQGPKSCVCRILAVSHGEDCLTFLFPGPMDMDEVNEEILEYRKTHGCRAPQLDCELCPDMPGCEILEAAGDEVRARRKKPDGA